MTSVEEALAGVGSIRAPRVLAEQVVTRLRDLIVTGALAPGTHLVETDLASAFNVSRGPVREALRQLLTEGLVGSQRGRIHVIGVTRDDVEELYHLRFLIEGEAMRLVTRAGSETQAVLQHSLEDLDRAQQTQDAAVYAAADLDFHTAFYTVAGHRRLQDVWLMYRPTFSGILAVTNAEDHDLAPSYEDHVVLFEAVSAGDINLALDVLEQHLEGSKQRFLAALERRTELKA